MKLFTCNVCGQLLYFENSRCERCGHALGFYAAQLQLFPLVPAGDNQFTLHNGPKGFFRYCANHVYQTCNWIVEEGNDHPYCKACELNHTIPNLSKPEYIARWHVLENAKHRLVYSLLRMSLPLMSKLRDPEQGLSFAFVADTDPAKRVLTGHANGLITINIAEADDIEREMARRSLDELYRTVLGHFRHESGHYYWDRLIAPTPRITSFRELFGDERKDYSQALQEHYNHGAPSDWNVHFISAYASAHPWEDWAETWAHYLHIIDTLETAYAFGLKLEPHAGSDGALDADINTDPYEIASFDRLMALWLPLTFSMNSLNRSMGLHDPYPFVITAGAKKKLAYVHSVCRGIV